jgi:hypothetical protein
MENFPKNKAVEAFNRERELFLSLAVKAYRKCLLEGDERPTQYDVIELLKMSRSTFNRNLTKYRTSWKEIEFIAKDIQVERHDCLCVPRQDNFQPVRQPETKRDMRFQSILYPTHDAKSSELFHLQLKGRTQ